MVYKKEKLSDSALTMKMFVLGKGQAKRMSRPDEGWRALPRVRVLLGTMVPVEQVLRPWSIPSIRKACTYNCLSVI